MAGGKFTNIHNGKVIIQVKELEIVGVVINSLVEKSTKIIVGHEILIGDKKQWEILKDLTFKKEC